MREDLQHAVKLARIELSAEEEGRLGSQLGDILKYVDKLNELDVEGVERRSQCEKHEDSDDESSRNDRHDSSRTDT